MFPPSSDSDARSAVSRTQSGSRAWSPRRRRWRTWKRFHEGLASKGSWRTSPPRLAAPASPFAHPWTAIRCVPLSPPTPRETTTQSSDPRKLLPDDFQPPPAIVHTTSDLALHKRPHLGSCCRPMPRVLFLSYGGGCFVMSKLPLCHEYPPHSRSTCRAGEEASVSLQGSRIRCAPRPHSPKHTP